MATCRHCGIEFETSWPGRDWCRLEHRDIPAAPKPPRTTLPVTHSNLNNIERAWELYKQHGTLQGAADHWGRKITRERIRQLLNTGTRLGLFEYPPPPPRQLTKSELIHLIKLYGSYLGIARAFGYNVAWVSDNAQAVGLSKAEYSLAVKEAQRRRALQRYNAIVKELGAHPNTTYLQQYHRTTAALIHRLWGSIHDFRAEHGIPEIRAGNPNFREDVLLPRIQRAKSRRAEKLARVLLYTVEHGRITTGQARDVAGCGESTAWNLIQELLRQGRIERRGEGWGTYYVPVGVDSTAAV